MCGSGLVLWLVNREIWRTGDGMLMPFDQELSYLRGWDDGKKLYLGYLA